MKGLFFPIVLVIIWQLGADIGLVATDWFPAPIKTIQTFYDMVTEGGLWEHICISCMRVSAGFLIGASLGTLLGSLTGYYKTLREFVDPTIQSLRNVPGLAWVPLFILWFGIYEQSKVMLIALCSFFPVYVNLSMAVAHVDRKLIEVGQAFEFKTKKLIMRIILPYSLPSWISGLRNGLGFGWAVVVAAELMGASKGLGFLMYDAEMLGRADIIIVSIFLFAVFGKLTDMFLEILGRRLMRYQEIA